MVSPVFFIVDDEPISVEQVLDYLITAGKFQAFLQEILRQYAIARECIEQLNRQMTLICDTFSLEPPTAATSTVDLKQEIRQAVTEAFQQMVATGGIPMVTGNLPLAPSPQKSSTQRPSHDAFEESEGVDFDEDALLGTLLDDATIAA
jgi:dihydroxyacid dehydratase/phosphogluconate dehydratase